MDTDLLKRITIDPNMCHGKPVIRGMRHPVEMILDLLSSGMTVEEISEDYPHLEREDFQACLFYYSFNLNLLPDDFSPDEFPSAI